MFGSLKAAYDVAKDVQALQISTEVKEAIADILSKLVEAREDALASVEKEAAFLEQIRKLKAEIDQLKAWDGEKQRYELKRYRPGSLAYTLKPSMAAGEPLHHLCANCYQRGEKAMLQATGEVVLRDRVHACPSCKTKTIIGTEMSGPVVAPEEPETPTPEPPYDRYAELRGQ